MCKTFVFIVVLSVFVAPSSSKTEFASCPRQEIQLFGLIVGTLFQPAGIALSGCMIMDPFSYFNDHDIMLLDYLCASLV